MEHVIKYQEVEVGIVRQSFSFDFAWGTNSCGNKNWVRLCSIRFDLKMVQLSRSILSYFLLRIFFLNPNLQPADKIG